jgi:hypothetical protein
MTPPFHILLHRWWFLLFLPFFLGLAALAPQQSTLPVERDSRAPILVSPPAPAVGQPFTISIRDPEPLAHVLLQVNGQPIAWQREATHQNGIWEWRWDLTLNAPLTDVAFYYGCNEGCLLRGRQRWGEPSAPAPVTQNTKLGMVFPNPAREWYGRSGWAVEVTYSALAEDEFWGVDDLAERVQTHHANGLRVLVRVDYQQGQAIPPIEDAVAVDLYLRYLSRLARDERLQPVFGYIIGSGYNSVGSNSLTPATPVTPEWYARVFNGYGQEATHADNAVQVIRTANPAVQVLVGPVQPWNHDQRGEIPYTTDAPWLSYFNTLVARLDESAIRKSEAGIAAVAPDGFALQVPGRVNAPELGTRDPAQEPIFDLPRAEWNGAQVGFQIYREWLDIINLYPTTAAKPAYITSSNTYTPDDLIPPAQNYPQGWLTAAYSEINQEPQIAAFCWFLDLDRSGASNWDLFSLTRRFGRLLSANEEFEALLQLPDE